MEKKLKRSSNGMLAGVCAGVAEYLGIDVTIVRIIWIIAVVCAGCGVLAYLICWLLMPKDI